MADWRVVLAIFIGGSVLTAVRRWDNDDPDAGLGVAALTVIAVLIYV